MATASILFPNWVSYSATTAAGSRHWKSIGLWTACASVSAGIHGHECHPFPRDEMCGAGGDEAQFFCSTWRAIGLVASLAIAGHIATVVAFLVVLAGGKAKRQSGWKLLGALMLLLAVAEFCVIGAVAYLYDNDDEFMVPGWYLDKSWYLGGVGATVTTLTALGLAFSAVVLPPELGYQLLKDSMVA